MEQKVNAFAKCRQWWRCLWLVWVGHPLPGTTTCLPRPPPPACSAMRVSATAASCQKCWSESSLSHRQLPVRSSSRYSAQAACTLHTDIPYPLRPPCLSLLLWHNLCHIIVTRSRPAKRNFFVSCCCRTFLPSLSLPLPLSPSLALSQFLSVLVAFTFWKLYARFIKI